ncbi:hypothetical protein DFH07DRAFT_935941 [Mycena maculata]|uniref:Cytochrome b5 heme-binding domain-containing protein n=1 Tax=Mycena maculata TaxID=230809 RepID=A0AAD7KAP8_9AGAR|nr:hypothetical protein DFH07DRAFT_935941 [Mycena maculata]
MSSADNKKKPLPLVLPPPQLNINQALDNLPFFSQEALAASRVEDQYESGPQILVSLKDFVFNMTSLGEFLGPKGDLSTWAFRDISYTLTKNSNLEEDAEVQGYSNLSTKELETLNNWVQIFLARFEVVGRMEL